VRPFEIWWAYAGEEIGGMSTLVCGLHASGNVTAAARTLLAIILLPVVEDSADVRAGFLEEPQYSIVLDL
jgi:hypothetical protein